ncbi:MAG: hypothetical protein AB8H86_07105 [Polyangiales bacterium]
MRQTHFLFGACILASGCALSHQPVNDSGAADAGFDVPAFDAGPFRCDGVRVGAEHDLINEWNATGPSIVALPRGEVGVFTLSAPLSIARANYQRLNANLERIGESMVLLDPSGGHTVPAFVGDTMYVSHRERGSSAGDGSLLTPFTSEGAVAGPVTQVAEDEPPFLSPAAGGLFWFSLRFFPEETIRAAHISTDGELLHDVVEIPSGNLIRGTRAVPVHGGSAHVLTYSRNTVDRFPRVSVGFVNRIRTDGTFGPERQLGEDAVISVTPVVIRNELVLVRHQSDALVIERANIDTLERIEEFRFDPITDQPLVAQLGGRLLVIHFQAETSQMHVDDFGRDFSEPTRLSIELDGPAYQNGSVVESPATRSSSAGVVITNLLQPGTSVYPWLVRLVCENSVDG